MDGLRQYVITVTAASILVGILIAFTGKSGTAGTMVKLLGGLFLALTAISPVLRIDFSLLSDIATGYSAEGQAAAAYGKELAQDQYRSIIKAEVEAYILDKAALYEAQIQAEVTVNDAGIPESAVLRGAVSPYAKQQLKKVLKDDLGITEEAQTWIG